VGCPVVQGSAFSSANRPSFVILYTCLVMLSSLSQRERACGTCGLGSGCLEGRYPAGQGLVKVSRSPWDRRLPHGGMWAYQIWLARLLQARSPGPPRSTVTENGDGDQLYRGLHRLVQTGTWEWRSESADDARWPSLQQEDGRRPSGVSSAMVEARKGSGRRRDVGGSSARD
jgi:hypothetical protein